MYVDHVNSDEKWIAEGDAYELVMIAEVDEAGRGVEIANGRVEYFEQTGWQGGSEFDE